MTEYEAGQLWAGYEDFLDGMAGLADLEREVSMEVGSF